MIFRLVFAVVLLAVLGGSSVDAVEPSERLADPALVVRARTLSKELRCLVCQNQSIDDSNAELAHDLRGLLRQRLAAGDSDRQILDYIAARYGMFVLLDPPFAPVTWLLWLAPPVLVVGGGGALLLRARRRRADQAVPELTREESARAALLLGDRR
jgi:cytochrome c-type biogenesis protein CcmH